MQLMKKVVYSCCLLVAVATSGGCATKAQVLLKSVDFAAAPIVVEGGDSDYEVEGYLLLNVHSKAFFDLAEERSALVLHSSIACESQTKLDDLSRVMRSGPSEGTVLIPYKREGANPYNLANDQFDLCVSLRITDMNPYSDIRSQVIRYELTSEHVERIVEFQEGGGEIGIRLVRATP